MNRNLKPCPACGKEVAKSAKVCPHCGKQLKMGWLLKLVLIIAALAIIGHFFSPPERDKKLVYDEMVQDIINAEPSALKVDGIIAKLVERRSVATDDSRDTINQILAIVNKIIKDGIVVWELPVAHVSKKENNLYIVATKHQPRSSEDEPLVTATVAVYARNNEEVQQLESLKKGDMIKFKGKVTEIDYMYRINIGLAVLWDK